MQGSKVFSEFWRIHAPHKNFEFDMEKINVKVTFDRENGFQYYKNGKKFGTDIQKRTILQQILEDWGEYKNFFFMKLLKKEDIIKTEEKIVKDILWMN